MADAKSAWIWRIIIDRSAKFFVDSRACVRVGNDVSGWFPVNVGLRQGSVMSPWLFNLFVDSVAREVNVRVLGKGIEGLRFEINQLLFADCIAL